MPSSLSWWFNGNKNLAYMWLWQDKTNSDSLTMQGSQALESHYQSPMRIPTRDRLRRPDR